MKRVILNILATSSLAMLILAIIMRVIHVGYDLFFTNVVFQMIAAHTIIHLGLLITRKFESKYFALQILLDVAYTTTIVITFGVIFNWFGITPIYLLIAMAFLIYIVALFLDAVRTRNEVNAINKLINDKKNQSQKEDETLPQITSHKEE